MTSKSMTMDEYLSGASPEHLVEIRWFDVHLNPDYIRERRATFYLRRVEWADHPWGARRPGGAPFENHWTLESRYVWPSGGGFHGDGRSGQGWDILHQCINPQISKDGVCTTEPEAWATLVANLERRLMRIEDNLKDARRNLEEVLIASDPRECTPS